MSKPIKKYPHKYGSEEWEQSALREAASFAPDVYECKKCGAPVIKGYCCNHCGDSNPSQKGEQ